MADGDRVSLVRSAYEMFNRQDVEGVLALLAEDVEWPDVVHGSTLHGKDAVRRYWQNQLAIGTPRVLLGDVVEIGDAIVATTYQEVYERNGRPLAPPRAVVNRFSFRGGLIVRMELTSPDEIPEAVRLRFAES